MSPGVEERYQPVDLGRATTETPLGLAHAFDGEGSGTDSDNIAEFEAGQDVTLIAARVLVTYWTSSDQLAAASVSALDSITVQLSRRSSFAGAGTPGIFWHSVLHATREQPSTDGAVSGGQVGSVLAWIDAQRLDDDVDPVISSGDSVSFHAQTGTNQPPNAQLRGQALLWLRERNP